MATKFENFLNSFDENAWYSTIESLLSDIHEVDRAATQIWFRFYPLSLFRYLESVEDKAAALHGFAMQGNYELKDQIDSSHHFLYGHRFWNAVKNVIIKRNDTFDGATDLTIEVKQIAQDVANETKSKVNLTTGISLVGLMTLVQVGLENFKNADGNINIEDKRSPNTIVAERAKDDSQGMFGFLKTVNKKYSVDWQDISGNGKFGIISDEDIATASAKDQSQNWKSKDDRCWEGVVPVECRSAACGTCWVGVLGGAEKLTAVSPREAKQMKVFGYNQPEGEHPFLRLSCQSKISGNVSIVIPPWNGVFGRKVYGVEDVELEPATTSAKKLRETIAEVVNSAN
ncbi:MAG: (2Fe-2S)-binding protein [Pyrinomonadaceae bacterium]|nr:(2Fe-2S)-binding protein [Pyrinomonadaceae bacterium]